MTFFKDNFTGFFADYATTFSKFAFYWIGGSFVVGAFISGLRKAELICNEPYPVYKNELIETPIRGVYHSCRVHAGIGGFLAGGFAMTAPFSAPAYFFWRKDMEKKKEPSQKQ